MKIRQTFAFAPFIVLSTASANSPCPIFGPGYPAPNDISSNSSLGSSAWSNLTSTLQAYISGSKQIPGLDLSAHTFSLGSFSANDAQAQQQLQFHYTSPSVANSSVGVRRADENSIYRIGSISKVLTVYLTLVQIGSDHWDDPVTKYIPELAAAYNSTKGAEDVVKNTQWDEVTLGDLAGQMAGVIRYTSNLLDELALSPQFKDPTEYGLPALNTSSPLDVPICENSLNNTMCTRSQFFTELLQRPPVYAPWTTPVYSNTAFELLAYALENITGMSFGTIFDSVYVSRLGMNSTSLSPPSDLSHSIIAGGNLSTSLFSVDIGKESAAGGEYSSLRDLNALGVAILNSTLLSPLDTRRWLKPITHTSDIRQSVGRPWEILRATQPVTSRINDLYTKEGDFGAYSSFIVLSPDHEAGFNVLVAGPQTSLVVHALADFITDSVLPAWEAQAAAEANENLAGTYTLGGAGSDGEGESGNCTTTQSRRAANTTTTTGNSSSITFAIPDTPGAGLQITNWTSNGVDMLPVVAKIFQSNDVRLYPTDLESAITTTNTTTSLSPNGATKPAKNATTKRAFRAVYTTAAPASNATGLFSTSINCQSWDMLDGKLYGKQSLDLFVFEMDSRGRAVSVEIPFLRAVLGRD